MATTSTLPLAKKALKTALDTGLLLGKVHYAWPGPEVAKGVHEAVWIDGNTPEWETGDPNIKAGRRQRQETYTLDVVLWVAKPELTAAQAEACDDRAFELLAVIENVLANDVQVGETSVHWLLPGSRTHNLVPLERGWGCQIVLQIEGSARLT